jgi:hypothetical protein
MVLVTGLWTGVEIVSSASLSFSTKKKDPRLLYRKKYSKGTDAISVKEISKKGENFFKTLDPGMIGTWTNEQVQAIPVEHIPLIPSECFAAITEKDLTDDQVAKLTAGQLDVLHPGVLLKFSDKQIQSINIANLLESNKLVYLLRTKPQAGKNSNDPPVTLINSMSNEQLKELGKEKEKIEKRAAGLSVEGVGYLSDKQLAEFKSKTTAKNRKSPNFHNLCFRVVPAPGWHFLISFQRSS